MEKKSEELMYLEHACKVAERKYNIDPNDADNLARWGGVLFELCQFQAGDESINMVLDAICKLEEALLINPELLDAVWCLGNAHMVHGLLTPDYNVARNYFDRAAEFYEEAVEKDPNNQKYLQSFEAVLQAPKLHAEIHKQRGVAQQATGGGAGAESSNSSAKGTKKEKNSDLIFDIGGWVVLAAGLATWWVMMSRNQLPPSPGY
ncbi:hypothetical protein MKW94_009444 [Papaver nudicaule]|uniref:Mitochondrial import receptor subunit TOM20 n=1 Tax=Papaver nudicaule TaxID=74823 RepID=A0AA41S4B6_PAPNU|nr:hypothetical protein [Papaver nudicaule]